MHGSQLYTWGSNHYGQLGYRATFEDSKDHDDAALVPRRVRFQSTLGFSTKIKTKQLHQRIFARLSISDIYVSRLQAEIARRIQPLPASLYLEAWQHNSFKLLFHLEQRRGRC